MKKQNNNEEIECSITQDFLPSDGASCSFFYSLDLAGVGGGNAGGGGSGVIGSTLLDIEPRDSTITPLRSCEGSGVALLSWSVMRERIWELMLKADINVRYWKYYETRVSWIEKISRVVLILSSVLSLLAWALKDEYQPLATATSVLTAFFALVVIPAFGLEGYGVKIQGIKSK